MKKGIAFVLSLVMCLGLVGCGLPDTGPAQNIAVKTPSAEEVYEALAKIGELVLDTTHNSFAEAAGVDKIVFRMPKEQRQTSIEGACYIEVYPSREDLERSAELYAQLDSDYKWLYSSGNVLLKLDGNISANSVQKYIDALQKLTNDDAHKWNDRNPTVEKGGSKQTLQLPDGFGVNEAYEMLKKELSDLEFESFGYLKDSEYIKFWDKSGSEIVSGIIRATESDERAIVHAKTDFDGLIGLIYDKSVLVSGNIVIKLNKSSEELFSKYSSALENVTGKPVNMEYSTRTES